LAFDDLEAALGLSTNAGWNQQLDDWRVLLELAPAGSFAAIADARRIVGTAIGIDYGGFGWIAMMLVDPAYRGCGVGGRLLEAAMESLPANLPVRLDATPLGRQLYRRYGFEDEMPLSRFVADARLKPRAPSIIARPLTDADLQNVIARDRHVFGGARRAVLEWALQSAPHFAHIVRHDTAIDYCFGRRGRMFDQIGPIVAADDDVAYALLTAASARAGDRPVVVDAFDRHSGFAARLGELGFVVQRPLFRMCLPRRTSAEAKAGAEFAIFGPEFG
jgi:GNAT superfamily N-acetyltransferase